MYIIYIYYTYLLYIYYIYKYAIQFQLAILKYLWLNQGFFQIFNADESL